jgi:hypothetical protein
MIECGKQMKINNYDKSELFSDLWDKHNMQFLLITPPTDSATAATTSTLVLSMPTGTSAIPRKKTYNPSNPTCWYNDWT